MKVIDFDEFAQNTIEICCSFCQHFSNNVDSKYYSYCLKDKDNICEIQCEYAQYCFNWCPLEDYKQADHDNAR